MNQKQLNNIFLFCAPADKEWTDSLKTQLQQKGFSLVFFNERLLSGTPCLSLWNETYEILINTQYAMFILNEEMPPDYLKNLEILSGLWSELMGRHRKCILIIRNDAAIPPFLKFSTYISAEENRSIESIVIEAGYTLLPVKNSPPRKIRKKVFLGLKEAATDILNSVKIRLEFDLYFSSRYGYFNSYDLTPYSEVAWLSLPYRGKMVYLSYWGYRAVKSLGLDGYRAIAADTSVFLEKAFEANSMVNHFTELPEGFATEPSMRKTLLALEYMLEIDNNIEFVSDIVLRLLQQSGEYFNADGGCSDIHGEGQESCLITTLYFIILFSRLIRTENPLILPVRYKNHLKGLLEKAHLYIIRLWEIKRWEYGGIPWELAAVNIFNGYAPFADSSVELKDYCRIFLEQVNLKGEISNPYPGTEFFISSYCQILRITYSFKFMLDFTGTEEEYNKLRMMVENICYNYSESQSLTSYDLYLLGEIIKNIS